MSELIDNTHRKKELLKHLMLQVQEGKAPEAVKNQLAHIMGEVPYETVVEVEQELLGEGLSTDQILKFCDIHTKVLKGQITGKEEKDLPIGHPARTFQEENRSLRWELEGLERLSKELEALPEDEPAGEVLDQIKIRFHALADIEKHYDRKENLLFPYLEKHRITGPSKVMWAKDDQAREMVNAGIEALRELNGATAGEVRAVVELVLEPAKEGIEDMIYREEEILIPLSLDTLSEAEWFSIYQQSPEFGFCLYDPPGEWNPLVAMPEAEDKDLKGDRVQLPSGSMTPAEIAAILNTTPFDLTFVDKDDRVRYFTQGRERIFSRSRAILGRKVQLCHPPSSVHIVEQIVEDFRSGKQSRAPFWINLKGKFIHIEYFALRDRNGEYLGILEVSQDLTEKRKLAGEQRLLSYAEGNSNES